jgi:hypothetical protein
MRGLQFSAGLRASIAVGVAAVGLVPFSGCIYHPRYEVALSGLFDLPPTTLTESSETVVFEEPDRLQVTHGKGCAKMENEQGALRVEQSHRLPVYASDATVFLNGSDARFLSSDHHIHRVATVLGRIKSDHGALNWQAAAAFEDKNGDDAFEWCYTFTILAWNASQMRARANHDDGLINSGDGRDGSALQSLPGYSQQWYAGNDPFAVLPRGFGVAWANDRKLHQLGYALGASERFLQSKREYRVPDQQIRPEPSLFGPGVVSWDGATVFKDDQSQTDYRAAQLVSVFGGDDVGIIQPPFTLVPARANGCANVQDAHPPHTNDHVVERVPYAWAVPILAAWDLTYICDDHNVAHAGAMLDSFSYERAPGAATGTLHYRVTTNLADKDAKPEHTSRYTIHILGIRERTTVR